MTTKADLDWMREFDRRFWVLAKMDAAELTALVSDATARAAFSARHSFEHDDAAVLRAVEGEMSFRAR